MKMKQNLLIRQTASRFLRPRIQVLASFRDGKFHLHSQDSTNTTFALPFGISGTGEKQGSVGWSARRENALESARKQLIRIFFPQNYPASVTQNYFEFIRWTFLGSISGTVSGGIFKLVSYRKILILAVVLSTQALLSALGMGSGALPMAASLNWIIKDGLGLFGGVIYTSLVSNKFDAEPKKYRFRASVALQAATVCELMAPLVPGMFLLLASASNVGKNMAWLALSGTRAQMHQSLCRRDNLGDVTAKSGSQTTAAGLIGTGLGVLVSALINPTVSTSFLMFLPLGALNLYSVYRSNNVVHTRSLNTQRLERVLKVYFENGVVPSPAHISTLENFVRPYKSVFHNRTLLVNPPIDKLLQNKDERQVSDLVSKMASDGYAIIESDVSRDLSLLIKHGAESKQVISGFYHACRLRNAPSDVARQRKEVGNDEVGAFMTALEQAGWSTTDTFIGEQSRIKLTTTNVH